jgi:transposase
MVQRQQRQPREAALSGMAAAGRTVRLSEELWSKLEAILLSYDPPARVGRRRTGQRRVMEAVLYRIATNCAWHELPAGYPHPSSVYRSYRRWLRTGALGEVLIALQEHVGQRRRQTQQSGR